MEGDVNPTPASSLHKCDELRALWLVVLWFMPGELQQSEISLVCLPSAVEGILFDGGHRAPLFSSPRSDFFIQTVSGSEDSYLVCAISLKSIGTTRL